MRSSAVLYSLRIPRIVLNPANIMLTTLTKFYERQEWVMNLDLFHIQRGEKGIEKCATTIQLTRRPDEKGSTEECLSRPSPPKRSSKIQAFNKLIENKAKIVISCT